MKGKWQFWIDRGGTFTDIVAQTPTGETRVYKLLSENPDRYLDAPLQGIRDLMQIPDSEPIPADRIATIKMGTTVATNALLERKGDRTLFITTQGFRDGLRIGYQNRPDIFARQIVLPEMLYDRVVEVPERMSATGEVLQAITPEIETQILEQLQAIVREGITACAIAFLHGDRYPQHEHHIAQLAQRAGFTQISQSHQVSPLIKWVSRSDTTVVDAYLSPILRRYVDRIESAFGVGESSPQILFMQSNGGLIPAQFFQGKDSILSGPAGGIVGAVQTSLSAGFDRIITFDMGGTSTDVAHFDVRSGYERVLETEVAGVRLRAPMMAIHTVAAGGGSILQFDGRRFQVGPASAGAYPGPACYRKGGPLTVTDCNVLLGKIQPQFFPKVFGADGNQSIDAEIVRSQFLTLTQAIHQSSSYSRSPEQVAEGFLAIAIDNMATAIKKISVQRGYDIGDYALCCFGAAGGQQACRLAEALGMKTIVIHPYAGVLSAYGMGLADRRILKERSLEIPFNPEAIQSLQQAIEHLIQEASADLDRQGTQDIIQQEILSFVHLRTQGSDTALMVKFDGLSEMRSEFEQNYQQQFGIAAGNQNLVASMVSVEVIGTTQGMTTGKAIVQSAAQAGIQPIATVQMFSGNQWHQTPVFDRPTLPIQFQISGPAILLEPTGTTIVEPGWKALVQDAGDLVLTQLAIAPIQTAQPDADGTPDPVRLEIFNNLFQSIAEQMGFTLQNTSTSVNIKERLDFSCAIFDRSGNLIANAPHIPVHLGSMGESVATLIANPPHPFTPGDVFISNNPYNGGTHLPDITAITPVFFADQATGEPEFFVASRGHHADIGGMTPGSMPPNSQSILEEGILFDNFPIVRQGIFQKDTLLDRLTQSPYPARNPQQNLADLQAQIAANQQGVKELDRMVKQFGLLTVQRYMKHVRDHAADSVRDAIQQLIETRSKTQQPLTTEFSVPMDCGATIALHLTLESNPPRAILDFTGTSDQQPNNFNAPYSVCKAAVLYVFRTIVDQPIPLNAGCLEPITLNVPDGCFLKPSYPAAVVAGNVETSQAITDAIYGALGVLAASQGTMNNFTFGNGEYQYYETIAGGSGAGPTFHGTDAVQTHMTNSRLTDPEILESRYPVLARNFAIRSHSGGKGQYCGGNGVIREIEFRSPMTANLLSGRRSNAPFGLAGGGDGQPGRSTFIQTDETRVELPATFSIQVEAGDRIAIETPGGGGYGVTPTHFRSDGFSNAFD